MQRVCRDVPDVSERRASKVLGQPRSTQRYLCTKADTDKPLVAAMHELAKRHPRYGYRSFTSGAVVRVTCLPFLYHLR